ncbi:4-carboxymuconolactone decarboxylase [Deinococcus radiomollis]|uniref:bifunctional 3-oxoadipate enol-lactonase/4-carboxymuconolactone decarboxylase PcaDC n=1 Tax=Deinococcus radiomollis TaxID=468916 RepID=UPI003891975F
MPFAEVGGLAIHYALTKAGSAAGAALRHPLVFLNSLGSDLRLWEEVAEHFRGERVTLRSDMRGHGLTDAPAGEYRLQDLSGDLKGLLEALSLEKVVLVGVSVGGMVALDFARRFPERVAGVVLCDTGLKIGSAQLWADRIRGVQAGGMEAVADAVLSRWFTPAFFSEQPTLARGYRTLLARTPASGYLGVCAALRDADLSGGGPLGVLTLVLCGDADLSTPPDLSRALADELAAPLYLIPGAGHLPCTERPEAVVAHLVTFLAEMEGQPDRAALGMRVRRAVLGDAHVDRAGAAATDLDRDFQTFITEYAWGGPWSRGHLDLRTRHLVTLAVLAALPREHELGMHLRATVNTGVTPEDLKELFMHVAVYAGVPVANRAYALAKEVLAERESI